MGAGSGSGVWAGAAAISCSRTGSGSGKRCCTRITGVTDPRRSGSGALSGWKPVAITVIFTASASDSLRITPKLICTSSHSAASRMMEQASLTSCKPRRLEPVMLIRIPREPAMRVSSSKGQLMAWRAASTAAFSPRPMAVPIMA